MNKSQLKFQNDKENLINPIQIKNKYAIYSKIPHDPIFQHTKNKITNPIFCGGKVLNFKKNVYNIKKNEIVGYISCQQKQEIILSSNLVLKISDINNKRLFAILPYASFAMKILRRINPSLGQNIAIGGNNFFSILLQKLFQISGANSYIIKQKETLKYIEKEIDDNLVINEVDEIISKYEENPLNDLILISDLSNNYKKSIREINFRQKYNLNQISLYDTGFEDTNYQKGIKYPYPYVRWDYKRNLEYFLHLIDKNKINLEFVKLRNVQINSMEEINNKLEILEKNKLYLFEIKI